MLNPHNVENLKQVGRSLYLLGKHKAAIDIYEEAKSYSEEDWCAGPHWDHFRERPNKTIGRI